MNSQSLIPFVITKDHNGDIIKKQYRPKRILESLLVETSISLEDAKDITKKTSRYIVSSGIKLTTAPFIREVVNTLLVKNGLVNILAWSIGEVINCVCLTISRPCCFAAS